jgi:hypothetical protein
MRFPSHRRLAVIGSTLAVGIATLAVFGVSSASAAECTVCLSPSGQIYDGRTNPYSAVPPPQPTSTLDTTLKILQIAALEQQLMQQTAPAAPVAVQPPPPLPQPAISATDRYSTSNGVRSSNEIQAELLQSGYAGPFDVPALLAAYQRATNSPVRPL